MGKVIKKRTVKEGIEITVFVMGNVFDVYVDITPEADISSKIKCDEFYLKLRLANDAKKLDRTIHLVRKNVKYNKNSDNSNLRLNYVCQEYKCEISLSPQVYVSDEFMIEAKQRRMAKAKQKPKCKRKKIKINDKYRPGISASNITKYSQNNVTRPYFGGRCTPK